MTKLERNLLLRLANGGARAMYDAGYYSEAREIYKLINKLEAKERNAKKNPGVDR